MQKKNKIPVAHELEEPSHPGHRVCRYRLTFGLLNDSNSDYRR